MRTANRNKQSFWYALYDDTVDDYDDEGSQIGAYAKYGLPEKSSANISPAKGDVIARQFGDDDRYDRVMVIEDRNTPVDEHAVLWIDSTPQLNDDGSLAVDEYGDILTPLDYEVQKVARGLPLFGNTVVAVSKVSVS